MSANPPCTSTSVGIGRLPDRAELPHDLRDAPPEIITALSELAAYLQRHPYLLVFGAAWGLRLGASPNVIAFVRATCAAPGEESDQADVIAMQLTHVSV